jgi:hypothetical protein
LPALGVLDAIRYDLKDEIDIELVTVDDEEKITIHLHDGRTFDLAWEGMMDPSEDSRTNMFRKLNNVVGAFRDKRPVHLDATFDDKIIGRSASLR